MLRSLIAITVTLSSCSTYMMRTACALVAGVTVRPAEGDRYAVKLKGHLAELIDRAGAFPNRLLVVAEDGFEPPTHGL